MNKDFFKSKMGVRLLSLVIAIFLYVFVASENSAYRFQSAMNQQFASVNVTETLSNVPVAVGEIKEDMFISGLPESVQVRLTGPRNVLNQVLEKDIIVETEDLREKKTGSQYIRLILPDLPTSVDYQITPSQRYVRISKIKTTTAEIEYDLDPELVKSGYEVSQVKLKPKKVDLTGDIDVISEIDRVFIEISKAEPTSESFTQSYQLQIVNSQGDVLDVNSNYNEIEAEVTVVIPQKQVQLNIVPFGEDQRNYSYQYQTDSQNKVTIQGYRAFIDQFESLDVVVDVTGLTTTSTIEGEIQVPRTIELVGDTNRDITVIISSLEVGNASSVFEESSEASQVETEMSQEESESSEESSASESDESQ